MLDASHRDGFNARFCCYNTEDFYFAKKKSTYCTEPAGRKGIRFVQHVEPFLSPRQVNRASAAGIQENSLQQQGYDALHILSCFRTDFEVSHDVGEFLA